MLRAEEFFSRVRVRRAVLLLALAAGACTVGPDYHPDAAPTPAHFKELKGWKVATPSDQLPRNDWWAFYRDSKLDFLIKQVEVSNQNVLAQAAAYEQARAVIREAQASLYPTFTGAYTFTRTFTGPKAVGNQAGLSGVGNISAIYTTSFNPQLSATWDIDVWGQVRRQIESNAAAAQATKADLDNAKLSAQAMLATAYFNLRATDLLIDLLQRTTIQYQKTLDIVENQYKAGYSVTHGDVATAVRKSCRPRRKRSMR